MTAALPIANGRSEQVADAIWNAIVLTAFAFAATCDGKMELAFACLIGGSVVLHYAIWWAKP